MAVKSQVCSVWLDTHGVGDLDADFSPSDEGKKFTSGGSVGQGSPPAKQSRRW